MTVYNLNSAKHSETGVMSVGAPLPQFEYGEPSMTFYSDALSGLGGGVLDGIGRLAEAGITNRVNRLSHGPETSPTTHGAPGEIAGGSNNPPAGVGQQLADFYARNTVPVLGVGSVVVVFMLWRLVR